MTALPNAHRFAAGFEPLLRVAGDYAVKARLRSRWWDPVVQLFEAPDPVIETEASNERHEIKVHLGGASSPPRSAEPPLTLRAMVEGLRRTDPVTADGPIYVSYTFTDTNNQLNSVVVFNIPTQAVRARVDQRRRRVLLTFKGAPLQRQNGS